MISHQVVYSAVYVGWKFVFERVHRLEKVVNLGLSGLGLHILGVGNHLGRVGLGFNPWQHVLQDRDGGVLLGRVDSHDDQNR